MKKSSNSRYAKRLTVSAAVLCCVAFNVDAVPPYQGGWVHDGIYAKQPLNGAPVTSYKSVLDGESIQDIQWAISKGMRQVTLNVGVDYLVTDGIDARGNYFAAYRAGSLEAMLKKVTDWNTANSTRPRMQLGIKVRLHAGTRQTKTLKDALGTVVVADEGFGVAGTVPRHWDVKTSKYSFRVMYERQMQAIANGVAQFNRQNANTIQTIIVPGNAFFYPEPFTLMADSRLATNAGDGALQLRAAINPNILLKAYFKDGSATLEKRSYEIKNLGSAVISVQCNGKTISLKDDKTVAACNVDSTDDGSTHRVWATSYPVKFQLFGARNIEKLRAAGLTGTQQLSYMQWLAGSAHDALKAVPNVRVGIALNPYPAIDSTDNAVARCVAINIGNAWARHWGNRAQIENYSYRSLYAKTPEFNPHRGSSKAYSDLYRAMEHWGTMPGVVVGVQLARTPRVWRDWPTERVVWDQLAVDAYARGWSFIEPAGRQMRQEGVVYAMNAWPAAYNAKMDAFKTGADNLMDNFAANKRTPYGLAVPCN